MKNNPHNAGLIKNSIGIIKEKSFSIKGLERKDILHEDVAFIELREKINPIYNYIAGAIAFILLLFGVVIDFNPLLTLAGVVLFCLAIFKKNTEYYLQVTFKIPEVSFVKLSRNQKGDAKQFIKKFYQYKRLLSKL